ncbi:preprotein translocase subunit YajC [Porphyrobacter sp. ULC335]|uniref:preprotein translocase subunit YajC n=1 Tax=Porphyrobacter sp. ULC335 TaxID=2854260 RepID=UPI00221F3E98|nr:preprotein translocase subunit YajC [Porphyrobacter sp. ULC335]UYV14912.1 preprotein translocase subunit YajC [Porphyrobacter sp. ULC335]
MRARIFAAALLTAGMIAASSAPAMAQDIGQGQGGNTPGQRGNRVVQPYIEVGQVVSAELSPGSDVVTFTQVAVGVDINVQGRNSGAAVSVRYERNIGYGDDSIDSNTISGVARGTLALVPNTLSLEAGALASRTRIDAGGGTTANPLQRDDAESRFYSAYAGPSLNTRIGDVGVEGVARVGYNRFEADDALVTQAGNSVDVFDDSVTYLGQLRAGVRPGEVLPVGLAVTAGGFQENISNLDQRVRDLYVRGDVTVPLTIDLALVAGAGYEDVEISSRDALRDANGVPVIGADGRFVTDSSAPRRIAFAVDGLLWDVGVLWRPSSRTSLQAAVGRRYDSTTYYGTFTYVPSQRSAFAVSAYDGVSGFGGLLNNSLAGLDSDFEAIRNPVTGDFGGLVSGAEGQSVIGGIGSTRSAAFRGRGVRASYERTVGRTTAALGAGYDRRTFIAAAGTVLSPVNGLTDESYYVIGGLSREIGQNANITTNAYVNWFDGAGNNDVTAVGASAAYNQSITQRLVGRAAIAVDYFDSQFTAQDFAFATALVGLRYNF